LLIDRLREKVSVAEPRYRGAAPRFVSVFGVAHDLYPAAGFLTMAAGAESMISAIFWPQSHRGSGRDIALMVLVSWVVRWHFSQR